MGAPKHVRPRHSVTSSISSSSASTLYSLVRERRYQIVRSHQRIRMLLASSTHLRTPSTSCQIRSASAYCPPLRRTTARWCTAKESRSSLSSACSHTHDHHASYSSVRIVPVKSCLHVWHSDHILPVCACCDNAFSMRQLTCARPGDRSARAARLDWRRVGRGRRRVHS